MTNIVVRGARQHNLKNVDVTFPRNELIVVTGPSGSGKSSLVFDTLYAEAERRYVDSLNAYARQFLDAMPKPDVDSIDGLSPAICIAQRGAMRNPRSTVGTMTEIHDHLRLLFARIGEPHCPVCGKLLAAQSVQQMVDRALTLPVGTRFSVLAPHIRGQKGELKRELAQLRKEGFVRAIVDGESVDLGDDIRLERGRPHDIDVVVDRIAARPEARQRLTDSIELALELGDGVVHVAPEKGDKLVMSERATCPSDGTSLPEITPRMFSFNNPAGACPTCAGLGEVAFFDAELVIGDPATSIEEGVVLPWGKPGGVYHGAMLAGLRAQRIDVAKPWSKLTEAVRARLLHGAEGEGGRPAYEGVVPGLERRAREYERRKREQGADEDDAIQYLEDEFARFQRRETCKTCGGARLRREALSVLIADRNIRDVSAMSIKDAVAFFAELALVPRDRTVAERVLREIAARLGFLARVGLEYLSLDRAAITLSGGEVERIRLATQIGSGLVGVLYVLDEPSIGLHPRDTERLVESLRSLRDLGNTVVVVEHDAETILAADHVIDIGPAAGKHGGRVVAEGSPDAIAKMESSPTGRFLSGKERITRERSSVTPIGDGKLVLRGARLHNLADVTLEIPLGRLVCITGVSGSGKSSLIVDTLLPAVRAALGLDKHGAPAGVTLEGMSELDKVVDIDQAPIGRTPRSNAATYTGAFGLIRDVFSTLPEARARGYKPGRFSFNVKGGRCESCRGDGLVRIEMFFLPDVFVVCEECGGKRYNRETLEVKYRGKSIADVLAMSVDEAFEFLHATPRIRDLLATLRSVGLGYIELGQSATTLSGGEAQRVKLARELSRRATGRTLYLLDEPTTGLHFSDVAVLLRALDELVRGGNSVLIIEHNLDVIRNADWIVDLGPEGGPGGGHIVAEGPPEVIAKSRASHTGRYLAQTAVRITGRAHEARA